MITTKMVPIVEAREIISVKMPYQEYQVCWAGLGSVSQVRR